MRRERPSTTDAAALVDLEEEVRRLKARETSKEEADFFKEFCAHFGGVFLNQVTRHDIFKR